MGTLLKDTVQATEGSAFITVNGTNRDFGEISKLTASIELKVKEKRMLGRRMSQHKVVGAVGKGSATLYFMKGQHSQIAINYLKTGQYPNISLQIINEDPQSTVGRSNVILKNVIFAKSLLAALEEDSEEGITFDSDFTFDDADGLEFFN